MNVSPRVRLVSTLSALTLSLGCSPPPPCAGSSCPTDASITDADARTSTVDALATDTALPTPDVQIPSDVRRLVIARRSYHSPRGFLVCVPVQFERADGTLVPADPAALQITLPANDSVRLASAGACESALGFVTFAAGLGAVDIAFTHNGQTLRDGLAIDVVDCLPRAPSFVGEYTFGVGMERALTPTLSYAHCPGVLDGMPARENVSLVSDSSAVSVRASARGEYLAKVVSAGTANLSTRFQVGADIASFVTERITVATGGAVTDGYQIERMDVTPDTAVGASGMIPPGTCFRPFFSVYFDTGSLRYLGPAPDPVFSVPVGTLRTAATQPLRYCADAPGEVQLTAQAGSASGTLSWITGSPGDLTAPRVVYTGPSPLHSAGGFGSNFCTNALRVFVTFQGTERDVTFSPALQVYVTASGVQSLVASRRDGLFCIQPVSETIGSTTTATVRVQYGDVSAQGTVDLEP